MTARPFLMAAIALTTALLGAGAVMAASLTPPAPGTTSLSLEMSVKQLMDLQDLPDDRRRLQLGLPRHCVPLMTAVAASGAYESRVLVMVTCAPPATAPR